MQEIKKNPVGRPRGRQPEKYRSVHNTEEFIKISVRRPTAIKIKKYMERKKYKSYNAALEDLFN